MQNIPASKICKGDIFVHDGKESVATEDFIGTPYIWVTTREYYSEDGCGYGYTSAAILEIQPNENIELIGNMADFNKDKS